MASSTSSISLVVEPLLSVDVPVLSCAASLPILGVSVASVSPIPSVDVPLLPVASVGVSLPSVDVALESSMASSPIVSVVQAPFHMSASTSKGISFQQELEIARVMSTSHDAELEGESSRIC